MNSILIVIAVLIIITLFACARASSRADEMEQNMNKDKKQVEVVAEKKTRLIQTYFFDDKNRLDFRKFCDYVLCIREDEHKSKYLEYIAELELLVLCCNNLDSVLLNILFEEKSIVAIIGTENEFKSLKQHIREESFTGTYGDFCYILFSTIFYLKSKLRNNEQK